MQRWLILTVLCLSGGIIFMLPFLREVYYIPMQQAFSFDHTQMGVLSSVFGTASLLAYFPGGWLADRFSPRKLMSCGLLGVALAGVYYSRFPSYAISIVIHAFWGLCTSLVFWGAMIKATRNWGRSNKQGQAFGLLESGRGISELASSSLLLALFVWLGSQVEALSQVILLFSLCNASLALLVWLFLQDTAGDKAEESKKSELGLKEIIAVLKMPTVWLISIIVLSSYSAYWGAFYFAPYATDIFGLSVVVGASIAVGKMWLKPFIAVLAGFTADRMGVANTVFYCLLAMTLCFAVFSVLPQGSGYLAVMLINTVIISIGVFALRGLYFALLTEGGISAAATGTAVGVISAIGFTPDVFMPLLGGILLDTYPGAEGYRYYFGTIAILCLVGTFSAYLMMRIVQKRRLISTVDGAIEEIINE
ncbi:MAG: MFS transporter [Proteobacteria bacterium]|nr:MFS transporter [Pseudomonadota bacterium]